MPDQDASPHAASAASDASAPPTPSSGRMPSARHTELLEAAYRYALEHGLSELSLRPLASAIGSSPRVLLYLFGSKDGLVRALLARARADLVESLAGLGASAEAGGNDLLTVAERVWSWLSAEEHRALMTLWVEAYARSLADPTGPWAGFARTTVSDWLAMLADTQPAAERDSSAGLARRTAVLAALRGALLDLLATGDRVRTTEAVHHHLSALAVR